MPANQIHGADSTGIANAQNLREGGWYSYFMAEMSCDEKTSLTSATNLADRALGRCVGEYQVLARVLAQPEMEKRRSPLVSIPPFGEIFKACGSIVRWLLPRNAQRERIGSRTVGHRLDEPARLPVIQEFLRSVHTLAHLPLQILARWVNGDLRRSRELRRRLE